MLGPAGHRPAVRRRQGAPPGAGTAARRRRRARDPRVLRGHRCSRRRRCSTPTRATPASSGVERIRELVEDHNLSFDEALHGGPGGHGVHDAHAGAGRHRPVPARPDHLAPARHPGRPDRAGARTRRRGRPEHVQHGAHGPAAGPARQRRLAPARRREPRDVPRPVAGLRRRRGADQLGHQRRARADLDGRARSSTSPSARSAPRCWPTAAAGRRWTTGHRRRAVAHPPRPARGTRRRDPPPGARLLARARFQRGRTRLDGVGVRPGRAHDRASRGACRPTSG